MHTRRTRRTRSSAADRGDIPAPRRSWLRCPGGLVADVLGAVTGIESKAVIDGTSLSGAMSQDRLAFSSAHQGARRSQGPEIRERAGRAALKGARLARDYSSPA
jgi:hypothetical protein